MTNNEQKTWGGTEKEQRMADLAAVRAGIMTLEEAQARAKDRRKTVGLSLNRASSLVRGG